MSILASLEPRAVTIDPGGSASVQVRVRNRGTIVEAFDLRAVGPCAPWAIVEPASLRLFPGEEGVAQVTFRPPRAATPAAGTYPFAISIQPGADRS